MCFFSSFIIDGIFPVDLCHLGNFGREHLKEHLNFIHFIHPVHWRRTVLANLTDVLIEKYVKSF